MARAEVFGKYQMLTRVAVGGMAEVWLARSSSVGGFEKLVAIKRMHPELGKNESFVNMFIAEAKLTVSLSHPNIVQIFDFGRVDDEYFMAMEFVEGVDLARVAHRARTRGQALPIDFVVYVMKAIFDGLAYAHARRDATGRDMAIIHRDVSPHNILLSFDGQVKISDFGIARARSELRTRDEGELFGKLAYVSPEQSRGDPLDTTTDLWSAGVIFHELLSNQRLFLREKDEDTLDAVSKDPIPAAASTNPNVPAAIDALVARLLERDAADRVQSAREMSEHLALVLAAHFPSMSPYRLADVLVELWDGALPRLVESPTESGTRADRHTLHANTKPVGDRTANDIAAVANAHRRGLPGRGSDARLGSSEPPESFIHLLPKEEDDTIETKAADASETEPASSSPADTSSIRALKKQFLANPNLWLLADIGEANLGARRVPRGIAALKLAAAKFAQHGSLIQASCIYRRLLELTGNDARTLGELGRLWSLSGMTNAELLGLLFTADDPASDFSEYRDLFAFNTDRVDVFTEAPILSSLGSDQLGVLVPALGLLHFGPGETILREGEVGDTFFLLGRGRVVVSARNFEGEKIYVTSLGEGDCFGEHAFFAGGPRSATVEAIDDVLVLEVSKGVLNRIVQEQPAVRESLRRFYKERIAESLLARSPLFQQLGIKTRKAFAQHFAFETYQAGDLIIREGDGSSSFYAIKTGSVEVYAGADEERTPLAVLSAGEIFGEMAALEGSARMASVRALEDCELLRMEAADLNAMLAKHIEVRRIIEQKMADRHDDTRRRRSESGS